MQYYSLHALLSKTLIMANLHDVSLFGSLLFLIYVNTSTSHLNKKMSCFLITQIHLFQMKIYENYSSKRIKD